MYSIGTDEAGYGPNLGPLVIVATVWRIVRRIERCREPLAVRRHIVGSRVDRQGFLTPSGSRDRATERQDLYETLASIVSRQPDRGAGGRPPRVAIADSKALYSPAQGLAAARARRAGVAGRHRRSAYRLARRVGRRVPRGSGRSRRLSLAPGLRARSAVGDRRRGAAGPRRALRPGAGRGRRAVGRHPGPRRLSAAFQRARRAARQQGRGALADHNRLWWPKHWRL